MKYFQEFSYSVDQEEIHQFASRMQAEASQNGGEEMLKALFSLLDITSLSEKDNADNIATLCNKVNMLSDSYPGLPAPAAICIYPELVAIVKAKLSNPLVNIASVGGGFPASQTFLELKVREVELAIEAGADEIDIVLSVGKYQLGLYQEVFEEIALIKNRMGPLHLKVILETGSLSDLNQVRKASFLAMDAGADFIKTSTGKAGSGADPQSFTVMCNAIKEFYEKSGRKVGIKPAGGISTIEEAMVYFQIVKHTLGENWLNQEYFRIGASRLADDIVRSYLKKDENFSYFN